MPANLNKGIRPNLKLDTSGDLVEWVTNYCPATPFRLVVESRATGEDLPPTVDIVNPAEGSTVSGDVAIQTDATDYEDAVGTLSVEWNMDGGAWQPMSYNSDTGYYEAPWDSTSVGDGAHTINAQATDSASNVGSDSNNVTVDNVNEPPVATFTYGCCDLCCSFDASASYDPDGSITNWDWNFGDGNTGIGVTASHTYAWSGTYTVVLTVTDNSGETGTATEDVSVAAPSAIPVTLYAGWTLIGVPYLPCPMTAEDLLQDTTAQGGDCTEIYRWLGGGWDGHFREVPYNDFALTSGEGYFVKCANEITYVPGEGGVCVP
jgi:hypothetical protein